MILKKNQQTTKSMQNYPGGKELIEAGIEAIFSRRIGGNLKRS